MNPFATTLRISPVFSRNLFLSLIAVSIVAMIVIVSLPLNFLIKICTCLVVLFWLMIAMKEHCWHLDRAINTAILRTDDSWLVLTAGDEPIKVDLLPGCLVQPWLTVLQFRLPDRRRKSLILLQDNMDKDTFRRLRVRLKNKT